MKKQIICINWGTKYGPKYINRLYGMVSRNITPPFDFVCFTDNPEGIRTEVRTQDLPPLDIEMPTGTRGIWPKSRLWGPTLGDLQGPVLYLDLDLMVLRNIDSFFEYGSEDDVILARNPNTPLERLGQTSIFRFPVGKLQPLQEMFKADPQGIATKYHFEQRFVTQNALGGVTFFPRQWIAHFRLHCIPPFPFNYFFEPRRPSKAKVVIFPGGLNQELAIEGRWAHHKEPSGGILNHIKKTLDSSKRTEKKMLAHLRHFLRPSPWVNTEWCE
jgi:hypothetical protein